MGSKSDIQSMISYRAYMQFCRDISCVAELANTLGGTISIYEVMDKVQSNEKQEARELAMARIPVISKMINFKESARGYYLYDFTLRLMSDLGVTTLSVEDIKNLNLNELYLKSYQNEYQQTQQRLYEAHDVPFVKFAQKNMISMKVIETEQEERC